MVVHGICTFAEKPYPPQDFSAEVTGETVRLSWRGLGNNIIGYRVFRSDGENSMFIQMTPLLPPDSLAAFTDTSTTRPGMVSVRYYAVAVSDGYLDSNPTDTLSVMLPWNMIVDAPAELDQVPDSTGHVKLFWTLPETPGVVGYNIYRSYGGSEARKINETLIPFEKNSFTDSSPIGYGAYDYFVESIGSAGRPSASRTAVHADRPVPSYNVVLNAVSAEKLIVLSWAVPDFPGLDVFYVYRQEGSGTARMVSMVKPSAGTWTDGDTRTGTTYIYTLVAEFKGGDRLLVNNGVLVAAE